MQTIRVLFLDEYPRYLPNLAEHQIKLEITRQSDFNDLLVHQELQDDCHTIGQLTESGEINLVVIANNNGEGAWIATAVHQSLRPHTVIVWDNFTPGKEGAYVRGGFKHFCSRDDLGKKVREVLQLPEE